MTDRDCIDAMIQSAVGDCPPYWSIVIADHLLANGVVVRENGEWIWDKRHSNYFCSRCGAYDISVPNFCPHCGADMRAEEQNRAKGENG